MISGQGFLLNQQIEEDSIFIDDLPLCKFLLMNDSNYPWFLLVPRIDNIKELYDLSESNRAQLDFETVVAPAMGGLVIGQEIARQSGRRYIFLEKQNDALAMRRGFNLRPGEKVLITEDVVTRGGRVAEALAIVRATGAVPVAITSIVDRSGGQVKFDVPFHGLAALTFPTYAPDKIPSDLSAVPVTKPGS